jgi:predicted metal-dependent peptidase
MNGEPVLETDTLKQKLEKVDTKLDNYLHDIYDNENINEYLKYTREQINALTPELSNIIASELSLYNFHIQKAINKNEARLAWCERELDKYIGQVSEDYGNLFWNEKRLRIIGEDSYASKLYNYITEYKCRKETLSHHTLLIKNIADDIRRVGYSKRERE